MPAMPPKPLADDRPPAAAPRRTPGLATPPLVAWRARLIAGLRAGLAAGLTLAVIAALGEATGNALLASSLGSTAVVAFVLPESKFARPRNIVFGHLISSSIGLASVGLFGPSPIIAALAVGVCIVAMRVTRTMQPPAGADPIVIAATGPGWDFLVVPILVGALAVAAGAALYRRVAFRRDDEPAVE